MHLQIIVGTKFKLKLAMLIFCTKFPEERYFRSKAEKSHFCLRPWSLFTILIFAHGGWQSQWLFNDSSNRRDNYLRFAKASFVLFLAVLSLVHKKTFFLRLYLNPPSLLPKTPSWFPTCLLPESETSTSNDRPTEKLLFAAPVLDELFSSIFVTSLQ